MTCKQGYWFGQQEWSHVFFAHWPVSKYSLQPYIPYPFQLDTFNNTAWLTIVAFQASASRLRFVPRLLSFRPFWQINIRTYIRFGKERGIYFLTLYSNDQAAVMLGKIPGLPYCYVPMGITQNENSLLLKSELTVQKNFVSSFDFMFQRQKKLSANDLHQWLTNRDKVYFKRRNKIIKGTLAHESWRLYRVTGYGKLDGIVNTIIPVENNQPLLMAGDRKKAFLYPFERIGYV